MDYKPNSEKLFKTKSENKILIAAHRGTFGGNIIQNTIGAYENALKHKANIIEIDASMTTDGDFFSFHDGGEQAIFGVDKNIRTMTTKEVESLDVFNTIRDVSGKKINRLDDVLEHFKGRCLINLDRGWLNWQELIMNLKRHNMEDQIIVKSPAKKELLEVFETYGKGLMYMPIAYEENDISTVEQYNVNMVAAELVFTSLSQTVVSPEYIKALHDKGLLLWANAIKLNDAVDICANLDDNIAILDDPDLAWGKLIDMGFDILQTDWPMLLKEFINKKLS